MNMDNNMKKVRGKKGGNKKRAKKQQARQQNKGQKLALATPSTGARSRASTFALSTCARTYLHVLANPFDFVANACVPDEFEKPSFKARVVFRGSFTVGSQIGFVQIDVPRFGIQDARSVFWSGPTYALPSLPTTLVEVGVNNSNNPQAPYPGTSIGAGINLKQFRQVGCGLRVRYTGTELNRGGLIVPFRHPENEPIPGYSIADMLGFNNVRSYPVDRNWHGTAFTPTGPADCDYRSSNPGTTVVPSTDKNLAVIVYGSLPNNSFEFEIVGYYEYVGSVAGTSPSHSDSVGLSTAHAFTAGANDITAGPGTLAAATKFVSNLVPDDVSGWVSAGVKVASLLL